MRRFLSCEWAESVFLGFMLLVLMVLFFTGSGFAWPTRGEIISPAGSMLGWDGSEWRPVRTDDQGYVQTGEFPLVGFAASQTITVGTSAAVQCPTLSEGGTIFVWSDIDVNFGGPDIAAGTTGPYIPADCPCFPFKVASTTPPLYFRGRTATGTVRIYRGIAP